MAADKTTKRKQKPGKTDGSGATALRQRSDPRHERRYEPRASAMAVVSMIGLSIGAVLLGAGTYGQFLRAAELGPHPYAPALLAGGALLLVGMMLFGQRTAKPVRVGDAGVALEKEPGEIERLAWRDVNQVLLSDDMLTLQGDGTSIAIPRDLHAAAASRALSEAKARIPKRVDDDAELPKPDDGEGETVPLEAPQVAGAHCKASDKLIAFEKDARLCGRCGEIYHKDHVPARCLTCDARLT